MVTSRNAYIELVRRQIYGDQPPSEANITKNLVNRWLNFAIAAAAKQNNKDNILLDGISYVNNSFYTTFKSIAVTKDENFLWRFELPQLPLGIGSTDGISTAVLKDPDTNQISYPIVLLSQNQVSFQKGMRSIPNKVIGYSEGKYIYMLSTLLLSAYTASVTMISGGDASDLTSTINVPDDFFLIIIEFIKAQLMFERQVPQDVTNDGADFVTTT